MKYFSFFNKINYDILGDGKQKLITDVFRKTKVSSLLIDEITFYTIYNIMNGERPDIVSYKLYGTVDYHWTFALLNPQIVDFNVDWPLNTLELQNLIENKYTGTALIIDDLSLASKFDIGEKIQGLISGVTATIVSKDVNKKELRIILDNENATFNAGELIRGLDSSDFLTITSQRDYKNAIHHFEDVNGTYVDRFAIGAQQITNSEYEFNRNDSKTQIKVIRPDYIGFVSQKFKEIIIS